MKHLSLLFLFLSTIAYGQNKTAEHDLFTLSYPDTWEMADGAAYGAIFMFLSEQESNEDLFRENVNILIEDVSAYDIDLDTYAEAVAGQIKSFIPDVEILSSAKVDKDGKEFHSLTYTGTQDGTKLKWLQHLHVKNGNAFVLTLAAEGKSFDKFKKEASEIMESIKLLTPEPRKETKEWQIVDDASYSITYPGMWQYKKNPGYGMEYLFLSKQEGPNDLFQDNVNITTEDLSGVDINLDDYTQLSTGQILGIFTDGKIVSSEKKKMGEYTYQEVCYAGKQGAYDLKGLQYYIVTEDKAYVLTYTAEVATFEKFLETAKKIMGSLVIK